MTVQPTVAASGRAHSGADRLGGELVVASRSAAAPLISLRVWLRGGAAVEPLHGLASLCGRMLGEGTSRSDWLEIANACETRGIGLSTGGGLETVGVAIDCLAEDFDRGVDLAAELLLESSFPDERLEWQREQTVAELQSLADQPEVRATWSFLDQLYHPHPLSRPLLGSPESLATIDSAACRTFHQESRQRGGWIALVGAVDADTARRRLEQAFGSGLETWQEDDPGADGAGETAPPPGRDQRLCEVALPGSQQMHLFAGHLTVARTHDDAAALEVLGVVLGAGNGLNGRFPNRLREREGLGYVAHAHAIAGAGRAPGRFLVYLGTAPENRARAERAIVEELERLLDGGITQQEFEDARSYLLGREAMRRETVAQRADLLSEAIFFGRPWHDLQWARRRYESLDRESVEAAMRRWLAVERLRWTVGIPAD